MGRIPGGSWRTGESIVLSADGLQRMGRIDNVEVATEPVTGGGGRCSPAERGGRAG